jgi:hypothetical protein
MRGMIGYDSVTTFYEGGIHTWDSVSVDSF